MSTEIAALRAAISVSHFGPSPTTSPLSVAYSAKSLTAKGLYPLVTQHSGHGLFMPGLYVTFVNTRVFEDFQEQALS